MRSSRSILPLLRAPSTCAGFDFFFAFFIVIFFLFLSYSFSSSSSSCYFLLYVLRASRTIKRERPLLLSLLFSRLSYSESRQLRRSRICPSIGAKQAHPLKRYATSLSTHGERERFTSRQYWSNVKPVWKPARKREDPLRSAYVFAPSERAVLPRSGHAFSAKRGHLTVTCL